MLGWKCLSLRFNPFKGILILNWFFKEAGRRKIEDTTVENFQNIFAS
jgi:hypothetical protein